MVNTNRRHKTPTKPDSSNSNREREAKQLVLDKCCLELHESSEKNGGRKPYGAVADMVKDLKGVCPWISRHTINFAYNKFVDSKDEALDVANLPDVQVPQNLGGRPIGTTKEAKTELKSRIRQCLNACASDFHEEKNISKRDGKYLKKGCLNEIIKKKQSKAQFVR